MVGARHYGLASGGPPALRMSKLLAILLVTGPPAKSASGPDVNSQVFISTDTGMDHNVKSLRATICGKSSQVWVNISLARRRANIQHTHFGMSGSPCAPRTRTSCAHDRLPHRQRLARAVPRRPATKFPRTPQPAARERCPTQRPDSRGRSEHVAEYPGASAAAVLLLLHDFPDPGKFPVHGGSSPLGHMNSPYPSVSGHAGSSPARRLPPAPGDRRSELCLPSWSGLCSRAS
jgi:hypothetical protein